MVQVRVLLFASLREAISRPELDLTVDQGSPASAVLAELARLLPEKRDLIDRCALAVNAEYAEGGQVLHAGDTVAVIPPVSGGCSEPW